MNHIFEGCYTSQSSVKRANRGSENALVEAEMIALLGRGLLRLPYPAEALERRLAQGHVQPVPRHPARLRRARDLRIRAGPLPGHPGRDDDDQDPRLARHRGQVDTTPSCACGCEGECKCVVAQAASLQQKGRQDACATEPATASAPASAAGRATSRATARSRGAALAARAATRSWSSIPARGSAPKSSPCACGTASTRTARSSSRTTRARRSPPKSWTAAITGATISSRVAVPAREVPGLGWRSFCVGRAAQPGTATGCSGDRKGRIENEFFSVEVEQASGAHHPSD